MSGDRLPVRIVLSQEVATRGVLAERTRAGSTFLEVIADDYLGSLDIGRCSLILDLDTGEFSSPKQGQFFHYNDFWHLDPATREWTRLESKGKGPPARSGHRMTYFKNYVLLFGGFQDTSQQTRYLQDLWFVLSRFLQSNQSSSFASLLPSFV